MDLRRRTSVVPRGGRENLIPLPGKGLETLNHAQPQRQRLALGEIGNKVAASQNSQKTTKPLPFQEVKKKVVTKQPATKVTHATKGKVREEKPIKRPGETAKPTAPKPNPTSFSSSQLNILDVKNIDDENSNDPFLLGLYASEIYAYLRFVEAKYPVRENYLEGRILNGRMRGVLVDWIVDVHYRFEMCQETLFLTVANIDRFMQNATDITKKQFQLVGCAAMFLASKYEEIYSPEISDFVYIADNVYSKKDILEMEARIVKDLDFSFGRPLAPHFLRRYSRAAEVSPRQHTMAKYFMELCLVDYEMCSVLPSLVAASALYLALRLCSESKYAWSDSLIHYSKYTSADISHVVKKMARIILQAETSQFKAVRTKYASTKLMKISCASELKSSILKTIAES